MNATVTCRLGPACPSQNDIPTLSEALNLFFNALVLTMVAWWYRVMLWAEAKNERAAQKAERERFRRVAYFQRRKTTDPGKVAEQERLRRMVSRALLTAGGVAHDPDDQVVAKPPAIKTTRDRIFDTIERGDLVWVLVVSGPKGAAQVLDGVVMTVHKNHITIRKGHAHHKLFRDRFELLSRTKGMGVTNGKNS